MLQAQFDYELEFAQRFIDFAAATTLRLLPKPLVAPGSADAFDLSRHRFASRFRPSSVPRLIDKGSLSRLRTLAGSSQTSDLLSEKCYCLCKALHEHGLGPICMGFEDAGE